jgi:catechol 2,3-dioxygenase-like lactoylglutathione lyase family enzyme
MFQQVDYIMITVSNMKQSIEFYRDKLGLQLKFDSPEWTEFVTGPTTLALHGGGVQSRDSLFNKEKAAGKCSIGFNVPNLDQTFSELKSRGVHFVMEPQARESEGIRLAVALDPDGLEISFAQYIRKD